MLLGIELTTLGHVRNRISEISLEITLKNEIKPTMSVSPIIADVELLILFYPEKEALFFLQL